MKLPSSAAHWDDQCCLSVHKTQVSLSGVPPFPRNTGFQAATQTTSWQPPGSAMLSKNVHCAQVFPLNPRLFVVSFANLLPSTAVASSGTPLAGITLYQ